MSSHTEPILQKLKQAGLRLTNGRKALIEELAKHEDPHTAKQLQACLNKRGIEINLVTIYREMEALEAQGVARLLEFGDGQRRIELVDAKDGHHHHLVCRSCDTVTHVDIEEAILAVEKILAKQNHFKIDAHQLEFFGQCQKCQA